MPAARRRLAGRRSARRAATSRPAGSSGVEFLGRVSDAEKAQLFRTADVFASPATGGESFGIVLLEAMAAGAPIVASDIHGYKGVVRRGARACSSRPHEPKELAAAIARLLDDPELRAEMGAAGRRPRRGVQLAAGDRQGRGLLRLRRSAAWPPAARCRPTSGRRVPHGAAASGEPPRRLRRAGRRRAALAGPPLAVGAAPSARPRPCRRRPGRSRSARSAGAPSIGVNTGAFVSRVDRVDRELERRTGRSAGSPGRR